MFEVVGNGPLWCIQEPLRAETLAMKEVIGWMD